MHVKDGGAVSAEEATATAVLIALEDAIADVFPALFHDNSLPKWCQNTSDGSVKSGSPVQGLSHSSTF